MPGPVFGEQVIAPGLDRETFLLYNSTDVQQRCLEVKHEDPARRYTAALANGGFYLVAALFGTSITGALKAFPDELIHIVAALALLPTIGNSLTAALRDETHREPAMFTFVVTLSGVTVAKIGSPFWGVLAGVLALAIASLRLRRQRA